MFYNWYRYGGVVDMSEQPSLLYLFILVIGLLPGAYFAWMVLKGIILSLTQVKDEDL